MAGALEDVHAIRTMVKVQCKSKAIAGVSSDGGSSASVTSDRRNLFLIHATGVTVLRAKESEKGNIPSLAISCLTSRKESTVSTHLSSVSHSLSFAPLESVNDVTTRFPNIDSAISPDITRGATLFLKST